MQSKTLFQQLRKFKGFEYSRAHQLINTTIKVCMLFSQVLLSWWITWTLYGWGTQIFQKPWGHFKTLDSEEWQR